MTDFSGENPSAKAWGGARNRRDRLTHFLSAKSVAGLLAAAEFSVAVKRPFQRHWTVHYERGGIDDRDGAAFVGRLLKIIGKAARRAGGEMTALWVRENGQGKGAHVHILLHLPSGMKLTGKTARWLKQAGCAFPARVRVSKVRTIGRSVAAAVVESANYRSNAEAVLAYLLKGASSDTCVALARSGEGGPIIGKRCGWTQNIGVAVRNRAFPSGYSF